MLVVPQLPIPPRSLAAATRPARLDQRGPITFGNRVVIYFIAVIILTGIMLITLRTVRPTLRGEQRGESHGRKRASWTPPAHGWVVQWGMESDFVLYSRRPCSHVPCIPGVFADERSGLRRIPRLLFATTRDYEPIQATIDNQLIQGCAKMNPEWQVRVYNDEDAHAFVRDEFPTRVASAYEQLSSNVERADFFRYLIVLRYGGVYVDMDIECRRPFDDVIGPRDLLVAGWEMGFSSFERAARSGYARQMQILQWTFAAAPGHPALSRIVDLITRGDDARDDLIAEEPHRDILNRTGPGVFTDSILRHALPNANDVVAKTWPVKILPMIAFGNKPGGRAGMPRNADGEIVVHHSKGSWKKHPNA